MHVDEIECHDQQVNGRPYFYFNSIKSEIPNTELFVCLHGSPYQIKPF